MQKSAGKLRIKTSQAEGTTDRVTHMRLFFSLFASPLTFRDDATVYQYQCISICRLVGLSVGILLFGQLAATVNTALFPSFSIY